MSHAEIAAEGTCGKLDVYLPHETDSALSITQMSNGVQQVNIGPKQRKTLISLMSRPAGWFDVSAPLAHLRVYTLNHEDEAITEIPATVPVTVPDVGFGGSDMTYDVPAIPVVASAQVWRDVIDTLEEDGQTELAKDFTEQIFKYVEK